MSDAINRVMRESAGEVRPSRRPHWLPEEVWLGIEIGKWPIQAFPSEQMAARWAADGEPDTPVKSGDRRRIFMVKIPTATEIFEVEKVPATTRLKAAR